MGALQVFARLCEEKGIPNTNVLQKRCHISWAMAARVESGDFAPNHPLIAKVAKGLGVAEAEIAKLAKQPALSPEKLKLVEAVSKPRRRKKKAGNMALVRQSNGAVVPAKLTAGAIRKLDVKTRQLARGLFTQVNLHRIAGKKFMNLNGIPTDALAMLLESYAHSLGVEGSLVVRDFGEVFD